MKIIVARPPNYSEIAAALPAARDMRTVFCYGTRIYNPGGGRISAPLRAHEAVHSGRQGDTDAEIRSWWDRYIRDTRFRYDEELPAHRAEYTAFCGQERDLKRRFRFLADIAGRLSGPLYGSLGTFDEAKAAIRATA